MNLPPLLRNKISHICLAGLTPGSHSPNKTTINHLLKPIVDELITLDSGVIIKTYQHPHGRLVRVQLLCLLGDLLATKKVAGFSSPNATKFCSWCHATCQSLKKLELGTSRKKTETFQAAQDSKDASSEDHQEKLLKQTGVRWSELNRLSYWDPSQQVALGIMHNWLEGILQAHWRIRV
ncbi:hypothetical protein VP01_1442g2 [Puccinia sorghi]|uniref:Uncharacterized protein n=1 Tax=Puccinia sorghi TaxID=27349 RepID=A0A0L6VKD1_9BASI|nr:hypothetical protein VP01_1442g2 [Puccinia sorghi]